MPGLSPGHRLFLGLRLGTATQSLPPVGMSTFSDILADALSSVRAATGTTVTYHRGATEATLTAAIGKTAFELVNQYEVLERVETRDYLVAVADLAAEDLFPPLKGDLILEDDGTDTHTYVVLPEANEPAYRYSDQGRSTVRIHTKWLSSEAN